jgi:osmotically-inducible protein OsmY
MKTDYELTKAVIESIRWNSTIQEGRIEVIVKHGWATLAGVVDWQYQKSKAKLLAGDIAGIVGVTNLITVRSPSEESWIMTIPLLHNRPVR